MAQKSRKPTEWNAPSWNEGECTFGLPTNQEYDIYECYTGQYFLTWWWISWISLVVWSDLPVCLGKKWTLLLIFFQFSSQWGFNLIIQPSDYLLIWGISLVDWYDWPVSLCSPLLTCKPKVSISVILIFYAQPVFVHLMLIIGRLIWLASEPIYVWDWNEPSWNLEKSHFLPVQFTMRV